VSGRQIPAQDGAFNVALGAGDGRLYGIDPARILAGVRNGVLKNCISIERDLLEFEIRVAGKLGADTVAAKQALAEVAVRGSDRGTRDYLVRTRPFGAQLAAVTDDESAIVATPVQPRSP